MTKLDLDAIEARCNAATPGPWTVKENKSFGVQSDSKNIASCFRRENELFIAHAREDIPALIARVRELEAKNERLQSQLSESLARERAAVEQTDALLEHGFVGGVFNPCDLCEFSAIYHDDQPCVDCENSGSVRGNWKLASGPVAEKCDIAKYAESCEDCGFCDREGQ